MYFPLQRSETKTINQAKFIGESIIFQRVETDEESMKCTITEEVIGLVGGTCLNLRENFIRNKRATKASG